MNGILRTYLSFSPKGVKAGVKAAVAEGTEDKAGPPCFNAEGIMSNQD